MLGDELGVEPGPELRRLEADVIRYLEWAAYVTTRAIERGVGGTPSVFVDGMPVPANARMIAAAVEGIAR